MHIPESVTVLLVSCTLAAAAVPEVRQPVPSLGCTAESQAGTVNPLPADTMNAPVDPPIAGRIAYYRGEYGLGVFAPRGWYCRAWYVANGNILLVTPKRIEPPYFPLPGISGPAVMLNASDAETSARFRVAIVAAQLFPLVAADFIARVKQEHLIADSSFDPEAYPDDQINYLSDRFVAYTTPANHTGLGTDGMFEMSDLPVRGLTILNLQAEANNLSEFRLRLPSGLNGVAEAILQLEAACVQLPRGCRGLQ